MTAIEQMMRGRLIIAAEIGGLGEVLGVTGLKFLAGDASALAGCISKAIGDRSLVQRLGGAARDRALSLFRENQMVAKHIALYEQLVRESRRKNG